MVSYQILMKKITENVLDYGKLCIFAPQNRNVMLNWAERPESSSDSAAASESKWRLFR